jgi:hypothetical protein
MADSPGDAVGVRQGCGLAPERGVGFAQRLAALSALPVWQVPKTFAA